MAGKAFVPHAVLKAEQRDASDPGEHVWLSASAGTGKTYVLSARVLRLLLRGVRPESILCLTFTKAGAAEMAERVHDRLAHWVRLKDADLARELSALGEDIGPDSVATARTLFAKVLEARGGGLRIMTIHAFCQTLLAGFPVEAGVSPGFRPLEAREEAALARTVLNDLVITAKREGDMLLGDLQALSLRLGENEAERFLRRAAPAVEALEALGPGLAAIVRRAMDVPADFHAGDIARDCADDAFDRAGLIELSGMYADWGTATGDAAVDRIANWLLGSAEDRARELPGLVSIWKTQTGTFRAIGPKDAAFGSLVARLDGWAAGLLATVARAELANGVASALRAAQRYARAYATTKRAGGFVDFDDLIRLTRDLLTEPGMGSWIRYKLDQATDHILVDEAQDTNADQWAIVAALSGEFWAGDGAKGRHLRTLFSVGDFKQAIFGFQGTDPEIYRAVGKRFAGYAIDSEQEIQRLSLDRSFRSTPPVLSVVDAMLQAIGGEALGLDEIPVAHMSAIGGRGEVVLFDPVMSDTDDDADEVGRDDGDDVSGKDEENWIPSATRLLAAKLAKQVKAWLDDGYWLHSKGRALTPGDVMILVRRRSDLAALLVARLHGEGVPVAGIDRLRLRAPLAVQDLLAAMRFAIQPHDDLNLAALLVSPLIGLSQDDLFAVAHGRTGTLWSVIDSGSTRDRLLDMLSAADNITPYAFLENLLSGRLGGRQKLLDRLGDEARDPIDELLNAALQYERQGIASLQSFVDWFDRGDTEIVRDAGAAGNSVRVMTVHGAKGLQSPLVILADACADPERARERNFQWTIDGVIDALPMFHPRKTERALVMSLETSMAALETKARKEHWRLLYVAMTRAEDALFVAGSMSAASAKRGIPPDSWHAAVNRALLGLEAVAVDDALWRSALRYAGREDNEGLVRPTSGDRAGVAKPAGLHPSADALPGWLTTEAPREARPPRPLAPSAIGRDDVSMPPPSVRMAAAAARGRLLHGLFERLPSVAAARRRTAGAQWLATEGGDPALVDVVLRVIDGAQFAGLFAVDALVEVPIAGVVDGIVIAGQVDRLLVTDTAVVIVDFKTGLRVPATLGDIPVAHWRQMAAYTAVIEQIFPDRIAEAVLVYTEGPIVHRLSTAVLAPHKPGFAAAQDNLPAAG